MNKYPLFKGFIKTGGFGELGLSGIINPHITGFTRVSDEEVAFFVTDDYGNGHTVTVTATRDGDTWSDVAVTIDAEE